MLKRTITIFLFIISGAAYSLFGQTKCTGTQIFTEKACVGDTNSSEEIVLVQLVNKYRAANGMPAVTINPALSLVANRRMLDLTQNMKVLTHSWSNCAYDINNENTFPCISDAPERLNSGYTGPAYETLYRTAKGDAKPDAALEAWKKSTLHKSILLNLGMFKDLAWTDVGVAIDGQYASLWFGYPAKKMNFPKQGDLGLGVSFDTAVAGLSKILSIDRTSTSAVGNVWKGSSFDRSIKLEISGTKQEVNEATIEITIKLEPGSKLSSQGRLAVSTLLKNMFPEWPNIEEWIDKSVAAIAENPTTTRTELVRGIGIEFGSDSGDSILLRIKHQSKASAFEVN